MPSGEPPATETLLLHPWNHSTAPAHVEWRPAIERSQLRDPVCVSHIPRDGSACVDEGDP